MLQVLPSGWRSVRLDEVCERVTVGHVGPMANEYVEAGVPFLRSQNVQPFRIDHQDIRFISDDFDRKLRKSALKPGDVVVVRTGYPGTAAVIPPNLRRANCADLVVITPSPELDPWFLTCIFNSVWGKDTVAGNLVGVAQQHFNVGAAKAMKIGLPPLPTQQRIAAILSAYDDLIENNTRRIAILEEMARRLYEEWFVNFRFPGHEQAEFDGELPKGWVVATLGDVADISWGDTNTTKKSYTATGFRAFSAAGPDGFLPHFDYDRTGIVLSAIGTVGVTYFALGKWSCIKNTIRFFSRKSNMSDEYLFFATRSPGYWPRRGAAQPFISLGDAKQCPVVVPIEALHQRFLSFCRPALQLVEELRQKSENLRAQRDMLLPKLISGEIDVSSAEELLEAAE